MKLVDRVRELVPTCRAQFSVHDVVAALEGEYDYGSVGDALRNLVKSGELEMRLIARSRAGGRGGKRIAVFGIGENFARPRSDPDAERAAGEFLQRLALEWGYWCDARAERLMAHYGGRYGL